MVYRMYEVCQAASQDGFFFFSSVYNECTMSVQVRTSPYTAVHLENACQPALPEEMYTLYTFFQVSIEIPLKPLTRFFPT